MKRWSVSKAAVAGSRHVKSGEPCGDAVRVYRDDRRLIAILSDGAGSAPMGHVGAEIITEQLCRRLSQEDVQIESGTSENIVASIQSEIENIRTSIAAAADTLSDFDATLVGVVATAHRAIAFHIGDGAAAICSDDCTWTVSEPANGEYANETYFFTMPHWRDHLRIMLVPEPREILLASDGAADIAFEDARTVSHTFANSLSSALKGLPPAARDKRVSALLTREDVQARNDDDKALIWAEYH